MCAKVMYTKTQERVKIIECVFFCLKGVYWESKLPKFRPARRLTKLEPNEIFNDFAISREPFDEIELFYFYFKGMDQKITLKPIGPHRTKIAEVGAA